MAKKSQENTTGSNVNLAMVAERCGVSVMTVSRALRQDPHVAPRTVEKVQEAARALGYDPARNKMARQMVMRRHGIQMLNRMIAVFFPPLFYREGEAKYFGPMFNSIMTIAMFERFGVLTYYDSYPSSEEQLYPYVMMDSLPPVFSHGEVDGVLIIAGHEVTQHLTSLLRQEYNFGDRPIVTMIEPMAGCSSVLTDDYSCAVEAVTHLLALGHRRIIYFADVKDDYDCRQRRLAGYRQAVCNQGFDPSQVLVACPWNWDFSEQSWADFRAFYLAHPDVTAMLAMHDVMAAELIRWLEAQGRRVPEDISVIGHDGTVILPDRHGENRLTTVRLPLADVGKEAIKLLIRKIAKPNSKPERLLLPTEFVPRATTAPPPLSVPPSDAIVSYP